MSLQIAHRQLGPSHVPYVIAELGVNHDGSVKRALELVDAAADAGADAVKLQYFEADRLLSRAAQVATYQAAAGATDAHSLLGGLQLAPEAMQRIVDHAHARELHAIVTCFHHDRVDAMAPRGWDAWKTASPDLVNRPLLSAIMQTRRPLLVSTGAADMAEIQQACAWLGDHPFVLMQCVSSYPTPEEAACLGALRALAALSPPALGYSDHTTSLDTGALAVVAGANVLEKHLTWNRTASGPDHAASVDPDGLREYVQRAHRAFRMLGPAEKRVLPIEHDVRTGSRQSVVSTVDLVVGDRLRAVDVTLKRPGTGLRPDQLDAIIGRTVARAVPADTPLQEDDLA